MKSKVACGIASLLFMTSAVVHSGDGPLTVPTSYIGNQFFAVPETVAGTKLKLLVDTGGGGTYGMYWIKTGSARRLNIPKQQCVIDGQELSVSAIPAYKPEKSLSAPHGPCNGVIVFSDDITRGLRADVDGLVGATYLASGIWTFDYPGRRLTRESAAWKPRPPMEPVSLGFLDDAAGRAALGFPRITVRVDGEPLDLLLDTGATAQPTIKGLAEMKTEIGERYGAVSYITTDVFNKWHMAHPNWRVLDHADDLLAPSFIARAIEVPLISIDALSTGPVWFTERPNPAFHGMMSEWMDKPIEGALGGNALKYFVMTIDYPKRMAWLQCVEHCGSVEAKR